MRFARELIALAILALLAASCSVGIVIVRTAVC